MPVDVGLLTLVLKVFCAPHASHQKLGSKTMRQVDGKVVVGNHLQAESLRSITSIHQFCTFLRKNSLDVLHTLLYLLVSMLQLAHRHGNHKLVKHRQSTLRNVLMSYRKWVEGTRKYSYSHVF